MHQMPFCHIWSLHYAPAEEALSRMGTLENHNRPRAALGGAVGDSIVDLLKRKSGRDQCIEHELTPFIQPHDSINVTSDMRGAVERATNHLLGQHQTSKGRDGNVDPIPSSSHQNRLAAAPGHADGITNGFL